MLSVRFKLDTSIIKLAHQRFLDIHERMLFSNAEDATAFPQKYVRENPRGFKHRTGRLIQGTTAKFVKTSKGALIRVKNTRKYAAALDSGSGLYGSRRAKYPIRAKNGGALRFMSRSGKEVITRKVMHPGIKPTRFLLRATQATARVFAANIEDDMRRIARRF